MVLSTLFVTVVSILGKPSSRNISAASWRCMTLRCLRWTPAMPDADFASARLFVEADLAPDGIVPLDRD